MPDDRATAPHFNPITSAELPLCFTSATHVIGLEESYLVFPAIELGKKDRPPEQNLNTDVRGPKVLRVDVHPISPDEVRRGSFGHSGVERLSLFLTPELFADWVKRADEVTGKPMEVEAVVDQSGDIERLSLDRVPLSLSVSSGRVGAPQRPGEPARTGAEDERTG